MGNAATDEYVPAFEKRSLVWRAMIHAGPSSASAQSEY
jgi:hypothetical protein